MDQKVHISGGLGWKSLLQNLHVHYKIPSIWPHLSCLGYSFGYIVLFETFTRKKNLTENCQILKPGWIEGLRRDHSVPAIASIVAFQHCKNSVPIKNGPKLFALELCLLDFLSSTNSWGCYCFFSTATITNWSFISSAIKLIDEVKTQKHEFYFCFLVVVSLLKTKSLLSSSINNTE